MYWNDASFEELSYVTGADSAEMGQGGMRVNMVPRDGGNQFHGQLFGNCGQRVLGVGQLRLARLRQWGRATVHAVEPGGQHDVQPDQPADQRGRGTENLGCQPVDRRAHQTRQAVVPLHVQATGRREDQDRRVLRRQPVAFHLHR